MDVNESKAERIWAYDDGVSPRQTVFGVAHDGSLLAATAVTHEDRRVTQGGASFAKSTFDGAVDYVVRKIREGHVECEVGVSGESIVAHHVQPTRDGFLLMSARCQWRSDGPERNAVHYAWDGAEVARFCVGDGVQDVRTTPDGAIWVSYFDEGVFGSYGWGSRGPDPVGRDGLVVFDETGAESWRYDSEDAGTDMICDLYAMNVCGPDDAWLYFYTDFPIVHVTSTTYRVWSFGLGGARAIAVDESRVLLYGTYEDSLLRVVRLHEKGHAEVTGILRVIDPNGEPVQPGRVFGVGDTMYFFDSRGALRLKGW